MGGAILRNADAELAGRRSSRLRPLAGQTFGFEPLRLSKPRASDDAGALQDPPIVQGIDGRFGDPKRGILTMGGDASSGDRTAHEKGETNMVDEFRKLTRQELDELAGEPLPERAAMSLINANIAAPINAALALNVLSDNSVAFAQATQTAPIVQGI